MISDSLELIYDSVEDMYDALIEKGVTISVRRMNKIPQMVASIKGISYPSEIPTSDLPTLSDKLAAIEAIKAQIKTVIINSNVLANESLTLYGNFIRAIVVAGQHSLIITGPSVVTGESCTFVAVYDENTVVTPTWSVTSGGTYASINASGELTINSNADGSSVTVTATYDGLTANAPITVTYLSGTTVDVNVETTTDPHTGETTTTTTTTIENPDGSSTSTSTSMTTDDQGNVTGNTTSETTTNTDGSSSTSSTTNNNDGTSSTTESSTSAPDPETGSTTTESTTTNYDENGDLTGSSETTSQQNTDGSSTSSTTNYDAEGDPTTGTNQVIDSSGNNSTQDIEYDDQGDPSVTGYSIDTSGNPEGSMDITGDGVNTEFVPFDGSGKGWICHIRFRSVRTEQPNPPLVEDTEDHGSNYLYTVLNAKSPYKPYPGFYLRWALKKNNMTGGFTFGYTSSKSSSTTQRQIPSSNNVFDLNIIYDPDLLIYPSKFRVESLNTTMAPISVNVEFNANEMDFTLGYATSQAGTPYRYASCEIYEFTISKLTGY